MLRSCGFVRPCARCALITSVKLKVGWIGKTKDPAIQSLTAEYLKRLRHYAEAEGMTFSNEEALLKFRERAGTRPAHSIVLLDSQGTQLTSEELASFLDTHQNRSPQPLLFAIGGADGFSEEARKSASFVLSLSRMTFPHELARVVLLEQLYRALSILKGHPYHLGH
jgi:23S rRNA (pseudouridine1915-N3)-methyltransferase